MIYCIGDANWDVLIPEKKVILEKQIFAKFTWIPGGEAQNTARRLWELGDNVKLVSRLGNDFLGKALADITPFGEFELDKNLGTGITLAFLSGDKRGFITDRGANENLSWRQVKVRDLENSRFVFKGGFWHNEKFRKEKGDIKLFKKARNLGIPTGLNLGWNYTGWSESKREYLWKTLEFVDFLFLNEKELKDITGKPLKSGLKEVSEITTVILHYGRKGCILAKKSRVTRIPTRPVKPKNPVGAGDAFNAGFIHEFLRSQDLIRACRKGNEVARRYLERFKYF